jgi:hypothetical protein
MHQGAWVRHVDNAAGNMLSEVSSHVTTSSVVIERRGHRWRSDRKDNVFTKAIHGVRSYVPSAGGACQKPDGIPANEILAGRSGGMEAAQAD